MRLSGDANSKETMYSISKEWIHIHIQLLTSPLVICLSSNALEYITEANFKEARVAERLERMLVHSGQFSEFLCHFP